MKTEKTRRTRRWRPARGALWIIAALLLGSAILRFASGTGSAIAREMGDIEAFRGAGHDADAPGCAPEPQIEAILAELAKRDRQLAERTATLADREAALALAEEAIAKNLAALQAAEQQLAATLAIADEAAEGDLDRLTAVYENMKPKEAAALFEAMAPEFAAGFLGRMRPDTAAAVMAGLSPDAAYTISVLLASRNAAVPKE